MSEQSVARLALRVIRRAGVWIHQGCGCEFGSRERSSNGKTCSSQRMVNALIRAAEKKASKP